MIWLSVLVLLGCIFTDTESSSLESTALFFCTNFCKFLFCSIGAQTGLDGKLSSHRSDYEIHSPEHRSIPKRPQSTAELVSLIMQSSFYFIKKKTTKHLNKTKSLTQYIFDL